MVAHKKRKEKRLKPKLISQKGYGNCPKCNSQNIKKYGTKIKNQQEVQQYKCKDCYRIFTKRNITVKEKRIYEEMIGGITRADIFKETEVSYHHFHKALDSMPDNFGEFITGKFGESKYIYSKEETKKLIEEIQKQQNSKQDNFTQFPELQLKSVREKESTENPTELLHDSIENSTELLHDSIENSTENPIVTSENRNPTKEKEIKKPIIKDDEGVTRTFSIKQISKKLRCNEKELEELADEHNIKPDVEGEYSLARGSELMIIYHKNRETLPKEEMRVIKIKEVAEELNCSKSGVKKLMQFSNKKIGEMRKRCWRFSKKEVEILREIKLEKKKAGVIL